MNKPDKRHLPKMDTLVVTMNWIDFVTFFVLEFVSFTTDLNSAIVETIKCWKRLHFITDHVFVSIMSVVCVQSVAFREARYRSCLVGNVSMSVLQTCYIFSAQYNIIVFKYFVISQIPFYQIICTCLLIHFTLIPYNGNMNYAHLNRSWTISTCYLHSVSKPRRMSPKMSYF